MKQRSTMSVLKLISCELGHCLKVYMWKAQCHGSIPSIIQYRNRGMIWESHRNEDDCKRARLEWLFSPSPDKESHFFFNIIGKCTSIFHLHWAVSTCFVIFLICWCVATWFTTHGTVNFRFNYLKKKKKTSLSGITNKWLCLACKNNNFQ